MGFLFTLLSKLLVSPSSGPLNTSFKAFRELGSSLPFMPLWEQWHGRKALFLLLCLTHYKQWVNVYGMNTERPVRRAFCQLTSHTCRRVGSFRGNVIPFLGHVPEAGENEETTTPEMLLNCWAAFCLCVPVTWLDIFSQIVYLLCLHVLFPQESLENTFQTLEWNCCYRNVLLN